MVLDMSDEKQRVKGVEILQRRPDYLYEVDPQLGEWHLMLSGNLVKMGRKAYANHKLFQLGSLDCFRYN